MTNRLHKRREFITLLGGAAVTWPLAARAQQRERLRRIGVLMNITADDPEAQSRMTAFVQELGQLGWIADRNVRIDYRCAAGDAGRFHRYAEELLAMAPDVILASATPSVQALQQATRTVPIVFANVGDPVGMGLVESLARPGGNTTGFSSFELGFGARVERNGDRVRLITRGGYDWTKRFLPGILATQPTQETPAPQAHLKQFPTAINREFFFA